MIRQKDIVPSLILGLKPCEDFASLFHIFTSGNIGKINRSRTISFCLGCSGLDRMGN